MGGPSIPLEEGKIDWEKPKQRPMGTTAERARVLSTIGKKASGPIKARFKFNNLPKRTARVAQSFFGQFQTFSRLVELLIDGKTAELCT
jgi:hypothetical protein